MSSAATWGRDDISTEGTHQLSALIPKAALDYRLKELKEVARTLFREIESLSMMQPDHQGEGVCLYDEVQRFETALIRHALGRTGGSQTLAAKLLGVKLTTLNSKIKRYKIARFSGESSRENDFQSPERAA
jgi:transcriptional regulator with GAF, ATPase, and Fis domain